MVTAADSCLTMTSARNSKSKMPLMISLTIPDSPWPATLMLSKNRLVLTPADRPIFTVKSLLRIYCGKQNAPYVK
jgi:hypothetical protein